MPRSTEIKPLFWRFVFFKTIKPPKHLTPQNIIKSSLTVAGATGLDAALVLFPDSRRNGTALALRKCFEIPRFYFSFFNFMRKYALSALLPRAPNDP